MLGPLSAKVALGIVLQGKVQALSNLSYPDLCDVRNHLLSSTLWEVGVWGRTRLAYFTYTC